MTNTKKRWTLMFFFASDNTLSPSMLTQLKALKTAGFQKGTNVLAYFDPNENGAPTRFFEINKNEIRAGGPSIIGDSNGPFVSDLAGDNILVSDIEKTGGPEAEKFAKGLGDDSTLKANDALDNFLGYCRVAYPATHYVLFLIGHGLVVGRDTFLPDDNPSSAITLEQLGTILRTFSGHIDKGDALELVAMHSCSMSALEVIYELKDTANYMMASEGISFVGAWPYRRFLIEIFRAVEAANSGEVNVLELMKSLHRLCIHSSADFIFAGYSADLCLSRLRSESIRKLNGPLTNLVNALTAGLANTGTRELIRLAHLESQSFWQETYTDLYDFCFCLSRRCSNGNHGLEERMKTACDELIRALQISQDGTVAGGPVVCSDYFGPECQYSHGLSVYFPWTRPIDQSVFDNYKKYAFTTELDNGSWFSFLEFYLKKTLRDSRRDEDGGPNPHSVAFMTASSSYPNNRSGGVLGGAGRMPSTALTGGKISPPDAGGECSCLSIKNFPRDFAISPGTLTLFT
jgi:hypothetical protein